MNSVPKGVLVALIQVLLVGSVGAKFLIDRESYPRVWIRTRPLDPNLPIRGRYLRLSGMVVLENQSPALGENESRRIRLAIQDGMLIARNDESGPLSIRSTRCGAALCWILVEPLTFFIPEHAVDPSRPRAGEELWVEASLPPRGPPRPIQLGVKVDGAMSRIDLR
ncbi:MAG: hypothetical protein ABSF50_22925 [Burkholderiaceae bacterium]|jgi:hypothetical protein